MKRPADPSTTPLWYAGVVFGLLLPTLSHAIDCQLACVSATDGKPSCDAKLPTGKLVTTIGQNAYQTATDCEAMKVGPPNKEATGRVELRYRHKGRWFAPPERIDGPLEVIFKKYPPDACGVPSPACIQARMNGMVAAVGGHGIDDKVSKPGGEGNPCQLALPCGVVLPPPDTWGFRLADAGVSGTWTVKLARGTPPPGQPPEVSVYIDKGVARLSGVWFAPGSQYAYRFVDDAGKASSSGEFSVASRATRDTLQMLMQRRVAQGLPEPVAWADTLAANHHDWDAYQLSLASQENR